MRATASVSGSIEGGFIPESFTLSDWYSLKTYFDDLASRKINSSEDLKQWILDKSELDAFLSESFAWWYIKITVDSSDQEAMEKYNYAVKELTPKITSYEYKLNQKLVNSPFIDLLDKEQFGNHLRSVKNSVDLFQEDNIPLTTEVQLKSKEYGRIFSEMTIGVNGIQMTLQKAGTLLEEVDRNCREAVYHKIYQRILQDSDTLESLFDQLLRMRHRIALNAGFDNFRDYKFRSLGRFDYTVQDCLDFHDSIQNEILPLLDDINQFRKEQLDLEVLRPWDLHVDTSHNAPLRPFEDVTELVEKTTHCLSKLHPLFGDTLQTLGHKNHLDLDSRKGKRPGGYNMPLHVTGFPFIFMNATHSLNDLRTLIHECGHAVHSILTSKLKITTNKIVPSEVAELAAMTMELLSMDNWDIFFEDEIELLRARISQLENVLKVLPWIATVDKFQHWIYTNPDHKREARREFWLSTLEDFSSKEIDTSGLNHYSEYLWHKQLHIFEVPFYYIEYGMAQLGAIAIWKRYREDPVKSINDYITALKLGYSKPVGEIYKTAGIEFKFSRDYVAELGAFVKEELDKLVSQYKEKALETTELAMV